MTWRIPRCWSSYKMARVVWALLVKGGVYKAPAATLKADRDRGGV
jgi:hypothetical protein